MIKNFILALIEEYELVKTKKHPTIRFASDLFKIYRIKKQNFYKYYHRYQAEQQDKDRALLPAKRGAKYRLSAEGVGVGEAVRSNRAKGSLLRRDALHQSVTVENSHNAAMLELCFSEQCNSLILSNQR
ncbi:hypothetical protein AGMMS50229_17740 [Campylobacterota bacterium]|nr:hypothetical protein AGMMS50229_17740 [Campylobacterota bacterium]